MKLSCGWSYFELNVQAWYATVFFHPRAWGFGWHHHAPCCKWWLVVGPFEISRAWAESDDYPSEEHEARQP